MSSHHMQKQLRLRFLFCLLLCALLIEYEQFVITLACACLAAADACFMFGTHCFACRADARVRKCGRVRSRPVGLTVFVCALLKRTAQMHACLLGAVYMHAAHSQSPQPSFGWCCNLLC
jgi:hypothetical protein